MTADRHRPPLPGRRTRDPPRGDRTAASPSSGPGGRARAAADPGPRPRGRPRARPGTRCRRHRRLGDGDHRGRRPGPDDPPACRHGRPAADRGDRARLRLRARRARCTPAATTRTWRCCSARRGCSSIDRADVAGRVLLMFQPGEEGFHGARFMLEEGLLDAGRRRRGRAAPSRSTSRPVRDRDDRPPARADAGLGRHPPHHRPRSRRSRLGAAHRGRPDHGRGRDRARRSSRW